MATSAAYQFYEPVIEPLDKGAFRQKVSSRAGSDSSSSLRVLSVLESSNNPNNRATAESSSIDSSARRGYERDSSYNATPVVQEYSRQSSTGSSSLHHRNSTGQGQIHGDNPVPIDGEEVMIEEKRKRASGDGYTYHTYRRGRMLGKGGFAKVYLCTALDTNKNYAVKIVPKANLVKPRARQKLQAEIKIHRMLRHENVCEFKHFFEDRDNCYILLELCHNQSMNEMIKRRKRLTEPEAAFFITHILKAVRYMHDMNVIHRDLKLGNLFLDKNVHIKVGDLGLACRLDDRDEKRKTICGTPNYIAPEVIQGDKSKRGHSFEVDIWSVGVILYTILIGKPPYEAKDVKATYQRILKNEYSFPGHVKLSDEARDLIEAILQSNPADRPSIEEIEAHPFLSQCSIPSFLPSSVLHFEPCWGVDRYGELFCVGKDDLQNKPSLGPKSITKNMPIRHPLSARDMNQRSSLSTMTASSIAKPLNPSAGDFERVPRQAKVITGLSIMKSTILATQSKPNFRIFDESGGSLASDPRPMYHAKPPQPPSLARPSCEDTLVRRARAMSVTDSSTRLPDSGRNQSTASCTMTSQSISTSASGSLDMEVLIRIAERLDTVLEASLTRQSITKVSQVRPVSSVYGPRTWVSRYVDYTTKYGLGFLFNDKCSGVYFNDSTKIVLDSKGEVFQYIERRKSEDSGRAEASIVKFTLSQFPESLKKKVTLLEHFRNYLTENQKASSEEPAATSSPSHLPTNFVFLKKWLRTKHAIVFRLSNQTIQVVFYDQTEILMTPDDRYITYVDKNRVRTTFNFTEDLVGSSPDMEKRLKYTKEIMSQLISGRR